MLDEGTKEYFNPILDAFDICCGFAPRQDIVDCLEEGAFVDVGIDDNLLNQALNALVALELISFNGSIYTMEKKVDRSNVTTDTLYHDANVKMTDKKEFYIEDELPELKHVIIDKLKKMDPYAFERLVAKLLSLLGFTAVKQMGGAADAGRDVVAKYLINGVIAQDVIVQCKRYENNVSSPDMQKFKGTMTGRYAMGVFVTTADFTPEAKKEAERSGTSPIQLINGERLASLMLESGLGVKKKNVVVYSIDDDAFLDKK